MRRAVSPHYPQMVDHLQPSQLAQVMNDRVKRISKINSDIADWIQERRAIETQYVQNLKRLLHQKTLSCFNDLGVFQEPWGCLIESLKRVITCHNNLATQIETDVETPLRNFQQQSDFRLTQSMGLNLATMAKSLKDAREKLQKSEKLKKRNPQKYNMIWTKQSSVSQDWKNQAPFIMERLQFLDEARIDNLRDRLTQYQTYEVSQAQRILDITADTAARMLEVSTEQEIKQFVQRVMEERATTTTAGAAAGRMSPPAAPSPPTGPTAAPVTSAEASDTAPTELATPNSLQTPQEDDAVENISTPSETRADSKLRRLGTMFGARRRQSMQVGTGQPTSQRGVASMLGRLRSSHGRSSSPPRSYSNINQDPNRLTTLAEAQHQPAKEGSPEALAGTSVADASHSHDPDASPRKLADAPTSSVNGTRGPSIFDAPPTQEPFPQQSEASQRAMRTEDSEGFTTRALMDDPISEAQRQAAGEDDDQGFKLSINRNPVEEENAEANQAALSNVANALKMAPAARRPGTVRGRRDVRNTIYVPAAAMSMGEHSLEGSLPSVADPSLAAPSSVRPPAINALASEASVAGTSDTQSVRSGHSIGGLDNIRHPDLTDPGLSGSIIETVSASFESGLIKNASIMGEIAFAVNGAENRKSQELVRINNFPNLERIGPNRIFVQNANPDQPDQFSLDTSHLTKTSIALSYRVFAEDSDSPAIARHAPLLIQSQWKPQEDSLGLLLHYQLNSSAIFPSPLTLHNVVLVAKYEGRASGVQTKPPGTHVKDRHLVYWRLGDVTLTQETQKIICRIKGADRVIPKSGNIEARWEYHGPPGDVGSGISISRFQGGRSKGKAPVDDDPFADQSNAANQNWVDVPVQRKLVAGKYEAQ